MSILNEEQAIKLAENVYIPAKPLMLSRIQRVLSQPEVNIESFAEVIASDVAMSAEILKKVNSRRFATQNKVLGIKQCVLMLGEAYIAAFAKAFLLRSAFKPISSISFDKFWDLASDTADMMILVHEYLNINDQCSVEDAYAFAMFRDCGVPVMSIQFANYRQVLLEGNHSPDKVYTEVEEAHFNINHAVMGFRLSSAWHLPNYLSDLVLRHHDNHLLDDEKMTEQQKTLFALSIIAVNVIHQHQYNEDSSEWLFCRESVLAHFHMTEMDYFQMEADLIVHFKLING